MLVRFMLGCVAAVVVAFAPASAATTLFAASGVVTSITGFRGAQPTGSVAIGDVFEFAALFEPAGGSRIFDGGRGQQVFSLPGAMAGATAGDFTFNQNPLNTPVVILGRGFSFFPGGSVSLPVLNQQFSFTGLPSGFPPFNPGANGRIGLILTSTFVEAPGAPTPTIGDIRDPAQAVRNRFAIAVSNGTSTVGVVEGDFFGGFAAAVPEPQTWALLILGFGVVGGAMRTRRRVPAILAA
jgi:hypothetical protein